jgi:hypothetical protein
MASRVPLTAVLLSALALLAALATAWVGGPAEVVAGSQRLTLEERFADGSLHIRRQVVRSPSGEIYNDGLLTVWYPGGQLRSQGTWHNGKKDGPFTHWHPNGQKAKEVHYARGLAEGAYRQWDDQGRLEREESWSGGHRP